MQCNQILGVHSIALQILCSAMQFCSVELRTLLDGVKTLTAHILMKGQGNSRSRMWVGGKHELMVVLFLTSCCYALSC